MAFETKVYNPDEVTIAIGPVLVTGGFADGEFLRIEQESDDTEDVVGTDGEVAVSRTNDRRATVTLMLLQTSASNDGLNALSTAVRNSPGMAGGINPLYVRDRNGRALYTAKNCWVQRPPDVSYDRTATSREWVIKVANLVRVDGGSPAV
jgi:hypothetical protein